MESIRREETAAEMAECTFAPRINERSVRMVAQRQRILKDSGITPCEQLYNDSMRRRLKQEVAAARLPEEATFMPRVNRSSVVLRRLAEQARASGAGSGASSEADGDSGLDPGSADVAARLQEHGRRYQAKLAAARAALVERPVDPATGRPLFQPETCRPPRFHRNPEGTRGPVMEGGGGGRGERVEGNRMIGAYPSAAKAVLLQLPLKFHFTAIPSLLLTEQACPWASTSTLSRASGTSARRRRGAPRTTVPSAMPPPPT